MSSARALARPQREAHASLVLRSVSHSDLEQFSTVLPFWRGKQTDRRREVLSEVQVHCNNEATPAG